MRKNSVRKNAQNNSLLATSEPQGDKAYAVDKVPHNPPPPYNLLYLPCL